ncbi:MAG: ORF6N domain-containing protein [Candidatus Woesebacteria bacterium]|nr:ORF6N domain-containing protein [Candidatus Woesebacteria bacterium]
MSTLTSNITIRDKIYAIRNLQVMLDEDLAVLYKVSTKRLNEQLKRNFDRFPREFCFQLEELELENLRSQFATSKSWGGRRYLPYVFTEQGVAMLSAVLKSKTAIKVSIQIMNAFVQMRKYINENYQLHQKVIDIERKQIIYGIKTDKKFNQIFKAITSNERIPKQKIFFEGQTFDAHKFISNIIRSAKNEIILIDNFIDDVTLSLFSKRKNKVKVIIYCKNITKELLIDLEKFNSQHSSVEIKEFKLSHDRFLIIDQKKIYHFGASLKDLGKKWFAVSRFNNKVVSFLKKLESK